MKLLLPVSERFREGLKYPRQNHLKDRYIYDLMYHHIWKMPIDQSSSIISTYLRYDLPIGIFEVLLSLFTKFYREKYCQNIVIFMTCIQKIFNLPCLYFPQQTITIFTLICTSWQCCRKNFPCKFLMYAIDTARWLTSGKIYSPSNCHQVLIPVCTWKT